MTSDGFKTALNSFLAGSQEIVRKHCEAKYAATGFKGPTLRTEPAGEFVRIWYVSRIKPAAWAYIGPTGDIFRPGNAGVPRKRSQGNIFDSENGLKHITAFGPKRPEQAS